MLCGAVTPFVFRRRDRYHELVGEIILKREQIGCLIAEVAELAKTNNPKIEWISIC